MNENVSLSRSVLRWVCAGCGSRLGGGEAGGAGGEGAPGGGGGAAAGDPEPGAGRAAGAAGPTAGALPQASLSYTVFIVGAGAAGSTGETLPAPAECHLQDGIQP